MACHGSAKLYALLIGIDENPGGEPLHSCVRDVNNLEDCIRKTQPLAHVTILASHADGSIYGRKPSENNIIKELEIIKDVATKGDSVFIHFSGHGVTLPPENGNIHSNHNTGDLALAVLADAHGSHGLRYLEGTTLAKKLKDIVNKDVRVMLVLDCCFSGSFMRNHKGKEAQQIETRYLIYDPRVDVGSPRSNDYPFATRTENGSFRDGSMMPSWIINPKGYSVMTACLPHELARHVQVDDGNIAVSEGALSFFLAMALAELGGLDVGIGTIYRYVRTKFLNEFPKQNPMLYGDSRKAIFGASYNDLAPPFPVLEQLINDVKNFDLQGGQAHGISADDEFDIFPVGRNDPIARCGISRVGALVSRLDVPRSCDLRELDGPFEARARTLFSLRRYPIWLDPAVHAMHDWTEFQYQYSWLCFNDNGDNFAFRVCEDSKAPGNYEIRDGSNELIRHLPENIAEPGTVLHVLEHLAKFQLLSSLSAPTSNFIPDEHFRVLLRNISANSTEILQGTKAEVSDGDLLQIIIENNGPDVLFAHTYNFRPGWDIVNLFQGPFQIIYPKNFATADFRPEYARRSSVRQRIKVNIPEPMRLDGSMTCADIFRIFITKSNVSLEPICLPLVGEKLAVGTTHASTNRGDTDNTRVQQPMSNDWNVVDFCVCVRSAGAQS